MTLCVFRHSSQKMMTITQLGYYRSSLSLVSSTHPITESEDPASSVHKVVIIFMKMTSIILRSMSFPRRQLFLHTKKRFGILFLSRADRSLQDHGHGCCCARHNWKVSQTSVQGSPINRKVCCDKSLVPILGDKPSDSFNWFLCLVFSLGGLGLVLSIVKLKLQEFMPKIEAKDHHQEFASIQSQSHETSSVEKEKEDNNTRNNSSQPTGLPKAVLQAKDLVQRIKASGLC